MSLKNHHSHFMHVWLAGSLVVLATHQAGRSKWFSKRRDPLHLWQSVTEWWNLEKKSQAWTTSNIIRICLHEPPIKVKQAPKTHHKKHTYTQNWKRQKPNSKHKQHPKHQSTHKKTTHKRKSQKHTHTHKTKTPKETPATKHKNKNQAKTPFQKIKHPRKHIFKNTNQNENNKNTPKKTQQKLTHPAKTLFLNTFSARVSGPHAWDVWNAWELRRREAHRDEDFPA